MTSSISERVARGAAWLDQVRPGWRDAIVLDTLDLISPCDCVLGQVYAQVSVAGRSGYWYVMNEMAPFIDDCESFYGWPQARGFASIEGHGQYLDSAQIKRWRDENLALSTEWTRVIHSGRVPAEHAAEVTA